MSGAVAARGARSLCQPLRLRVRPQVLLGASGLAPGPPAGRLGEQPRGALAWERSGRGRRGLSWLGRVSERLFLCVTGAGAGRFLAGGPSGAHWIGGRTLSGSYGIFDTILFLLTPFSTYRARLLFFFEINIHVILLVSIFIFYIYQ